MNKRKSISKKLRFEVFKRDKFMCQYCGATLPGTTLEIDHIKPVAKGGGNDLLNLVTSCFECNRGKSDKTLDDDSAVTKKKNQLDLLQENREQMEMMLEWSDGLQVIDNERTQELIKRINAKMHPLSVNEGFEKRFANLTKKHVLPDVLQAIEIASERYLKFDIDGNTTEESADNFVSKIGGVLHNLNIPPIQQKANYIKGICKNRFSYWNPQKGSILINNYIKALKDYGYNEEQIINDLDEQLMPKAKEVKNWTEWNKLLENWIDSIYNWDDKTSITEEIQEKGEEVEWDLVKDSTFCLLTERDFLIDGFNFIGKELESFNQEKIEWDLNWLVIKYLEILMLDFDTNFDVTSYSELKEYKTVMDHFRVPIDGPKHISTLAKGGIMRLLSVCTEYSCSYDHFDYMCLCFIIDSYPEQLSNLKTIDKELAKRAENYHKDYRLFLKGKNQIKNAVG